MTAVQRKKFRYFFGMYKRWAELRNTPSRTEAQEVEKQVLESLMEKVK